MSARDLRKGLPNLKALTRAERETMPVWVAEGRNVVMVSPNRYGVDIVQLVTPKRVTAKFVTINCGHYDRKFSLARGLEEAGDRSDYQSRAFLADPNSDAVKLGVEASKVANLGTQAAHKALAFNKDNSPETAVGAVDALNRYLAAWNQLEHLKSTYDKAQGATR